MKRHVSERSKIRLIARVQLMGAHGDDRWRFYDQPYWYDDTLPVGTPPSAEASMAGYELALQTHADDIAHAVAQTARTEPVSDAAPQPVERVRHVVYSTERDQYEGMAAKVLGLADDDDNRLLHVKWQIRHNELSREIAAQWAWSALPDVETARDLAFYCHARWSGLSFRSWERITQGLMRDGYLPADHDTRRSRLPVDYRPTGRGTTRGSTLYRKFGIGGVRDYSEDEMAQRVRRTLRKKGNGFIFRMDDLAVKCSDGNGSTDAYVAKLRWMFADGILCRDFASGAIRWS
jgi:hypothetical protein